MTLTLTITNHDRLDNGMPTEFVLHRRGAIIGRSPTCDWTLPDPRSFISSRHCEVTFADGSYTLSDVSMNGTHLNGAPARMSAPHRVAHGDVFTLGHYEVRASLSGEAAAALDEQRRAAANAAGNGWSGWGADTGPADASAPAGDWSASGGGWVGSGDGAGWGTTPTPAPLAPPAASDGWGAPPSPPPPPETGWGALASSASDGWGAPPAPSSAWDAPSAPPSPGASAWSSAAPDQPAAPTPNDIWGKLAEGNVVDWARGGFGQSAAGPSASSGGGWGAPPAPPPPPVAPVAEQAWSAPRIAPSGGWGAESADAPRVPPAVAGAPPPPPPSSRTLGQGASMDAGQLAQTFVAALGTAPGAVTDVGPALMERAGGLFRRLVAGLVVMVEARARAKAQMGAEATSFEFDGNNPIKFARTPEEAIATLLNPQQRGFMSADRAVEDAFFDLQSHQMATLKAMQGALRATLDRFSPAAIRQRAEGRGLLARILPSTRDAALWQAYEKEFSGVARGSDEAFMDLFAKEFRRAYEEQAAAQRQRGR